MAPSAGAWHSLVSKNVKLLRLAWQKASRLAQGQLPSSVRPAQAELQPAFARNAPRQPVHPVARLRQSQGRWYTTHSYINASARRYTSGRASGPAGVKYDRSSFPKSRVSTVISASTGRAPFASTLRPNLTGGTLGRTAGGYGLGSGRIGGARFFSHTPAAPAQVIQNVSQAVRAFLISGSKAQFDGVDPRTGEPRYKAVSAAQDKVGRKLMAVPKATPGSYIDFNVNPTITALTPLSAVTGYSSVSVKETLNSEGLLDVLSVDFSRTLKDLSIILNDLNRLSSLGDLPITYRASALRVHFPGCDAESVERLCDELGVRRGVIGQDEDFDAFVGTEIALLFPFAPSRTMSECSFFEKPVSVRMAQQEEIHWRNMMSSEDDADDALSTPEYSTQSDAGMEYEEIEDMNPWLSSPSGYDSLHSSEAEDAMARYDQAEQHSPLEYQGIEGICRFIEQCDAAQRR